MYWTNAGRFQELYNPLWDKLVPQDGRASTPHGELLRLVGNYYASYHDTDCRGVIPPLGPEQQLQEDAQRLLAFRSWFPPHLKESLARFIWGEAGENELEQLMDFTILLVNSVDKLWMGQEELDGSG